MLRRPLVLSDGYRAGVLSVLQLNQERQKFFCFKTAPEAWSTQLFFVIWRIYFFTMPFQNKNQTILKFHFLILWVFIRRGIYYGGRSQGNHSGCFVQRGLVLIDVQETGIASYRKLSMHCTLGYWVRMFCIFDVHEGYWQQALCLPSASLAVFSDSSDFCVYSCHKFWCRADIVLEWIYEANSSKSY